MSREESNFLTLKERELLDEIARVKAALQCNEIALTGSQFRTFGKAMKRNQFKEYKDRLRDLSVYSIESSTRHKKRDMLDMFGVTK